MSVSAPLPSCSIYVRVSDYVKKLATVCTSEMYLITEQVASGDRILLRIHCKTSLLTANLSFCLIWCNSVMAWNCTIGSSEFAASCTSLLQRLTISGFICADFKWFNRI